jgi:hypothetical protein
MSVCLAWVAFLGGKRWGGGGFQVHEAQIRPEEMKQLAAQLFAGWAHPCNTVSRMRDSSSANSNQKHKCQVRIGRRAGGLCV